MKVYRYSDYAIQLSRNIENVTINYIIYAMVIRTIMKPIYLCLVVYEIKRYFNINSITVELASTSTSTSEYQHRIRININNQHKVNNENVNYRNASMDQEKSARQSEYEIIGKLAQILTPEIYEYTHQKNSNGTPNQVYQNDFKEILKDSPLFSLTWFYSLCGNNITIGCIDDKGVDQDIQDDENEDSN
ncbi:hypothetical protein ACTA71_007021 [Dictyostelium dimigraforme]